MLLSSTECKSDCNKLLGTGCFCRKRKSHGSSLINGTNHSSLTSCHNTKPGVNTSFSCLNNNPHQQPSENADNPACMLNARVSETQLLETIKLETLAVRWRLLPDGLIERVLIDQPMSKLHPHNLHSLRSVTLLPKTSKVRLVVTEFSEEFGFRRNVAWIARFTSRKEAKSWLCIIEMISKECCSGSHNGAKSTILVQEQITSIGSARDNGHLALLKSGDGTTMSLLTDEPLRESFITTEKGVKVGPPKPPRTKFASSMTLGTNDTDILLDDRERPIPNYGRSFQYITQSVSQLFTGQSASSVVRLRLPTPTSHPASGKIHESGHIVRNQPLLLSRPSSVAVTQISVTPSGNLSRRHIVLRGFLEKHQSRHLRALRFRAWYPVTWILYSDGILEEYSKIKSCHDLLNSFSLCEFEVRVPMTKADERMGGPNFTIPVDCYLNLIRTVTGRKTAYKAPNKLMQIQWLAALTLRASSAKKKALGTEIPTAVRTTNSNTTELNVPEKCRIPRKLSILQEKCLVDIFGLIIPLWINVIWEYSERSVIRRRYEDSSRQVAKQVTILDELALQKEHVLSIPESNKSKRRNLPSSYHGDGHWVVSQKSKRRFIISRSDGRKDDDIYVRADSSQLRDEWYYILRNLHNTSVTPIPCSKTTPILQGLVPPEYPLSTTVVESVSLSSVRETKSTLDYSVKERPTILPESFSMPATNYPAINDDLVVSDSFSCSFVEGDERLFWPSIAIKRFRYSCIKDNDLSDVASRKRAVTNCGQESFEVLPPLTEDVA